MRILIISDIHANWTALRAVAAAVTDIDRIAFLGDAVDYGPRPVECSRWVLEHADTMIRGNHDNAAGNGEDPRCAPAYTAMAEATLELHRQLLSADDKERLGSLPLAARFEADGRTVYAVHAAPQDPLFQYLPRDASDEEVARALAPVDADVVLMGHTHWPFVRRVDGKLVANPGSVGQPKDGDPRAAYAIWEDGEIALCRAHYAVEETVRQLQAQPLPEGIVADLVHVLRQGSD